MAKVAKIILAPISLVIGDKATAALLSIAALIPGPQQPFVAAGAAAFSTLARITAPKPVARGSATTVVLDVEPGRPCLIGQVMTGGVIRYDSAYGATLKKVPNPYRWQIRVLSGVGPIQGIVGEFFDFQPISSYYAGFFNSTQSLGQRPQTSALVPPYGAAPGWTTSSRLSGCAHVGLNFLFDRDGERFASGVPVYTALCDGEKVYDPRQDSTYPGGSGPCRAGVESTYVFNRNPACHAVTYALGRFQNGKRLMGLGLSVDAIDMPAIVDWANDCDANGWTVNMVLTEGGTNADLRGQRVRNIDDICAAGGARWFPAGGLLSFDWHRPRISLATLTDDDILEAGGSTDAIQSVRERMNGIRPQYISPANNWQQVTGDEIIGTTYRTEDGTNLTQVYPLNGVTNADQAGELAAYAMADSREIGPMEMQVKSLWRFYLPGDTITIDSSLAAYSGQAVIGQRTLNPETLAVGLSLKSETPGKHAFALGKVAVPPPTPVLAQTAEERDILAAAALAPRGVDVADLVEPGNANRVPFSRMEGGRGWAVLFNPVPLGTALEYGTSLRGFSFFAVDASPTASSQQISIGNSTTKAFKVFEFERLSVQARVSISGTATGTWSLEFWSYEADGVTGSGTVVASGTDQPTYLLGLKEGFVDVPANRAFGRLELRFTSSSSGSVEIGIAEPLVTGAALLQVEHAPFSPGPNADDGADVTITIAGPSSDALTYTSTGVLDPTDQLPRTYVYTLSNRSGLLTSGTTWNYRIIEGTVNGFTAGTTLRSMSVSSGAGQFALSSLGSNAAQVEIIGSFGGGSVSMFLQLNKTFAPPPTGGGGGGPASASQSSGFASVTSSSFATVSSELEVTSTGTTQTVTANMQFSPPLTSESSSTIEVQLERWNGSAWVAMGAAVTANSSTTFDIELNRYIRSQAVFNFTRTATITAGSNQRTRVRARRSAGTVTHASSGTLTLTA